MQFRACVATWLGFLRLGSQVRDRRNVEGVAPQLVNRTERCGVGPPALALLSMGAIDGQVVRIRGHSPSFAAVDQLQASLRRDSRFDDIRVSEIQADAKRGGNTFSLTISLAPAGASS